MKLVLAEKPSVAQSYAKVLGANKRCDGYGNAAGCQEPHYHQKNQQFHTFQFP